MHIQEVVIEGFKSYAQRTVVQGWDAQFNAITGLNGSGKSNILDAICFVLGINNLSQVRASNLQDLVYKQGQAGVTKASVTVVFNNSDSSTSPIGYEHHETISVCRQIVLGGRNKYMINGHTVQASQVQNFFHSVQLNVNNPHFLIMQGRITKVLNMKPPEILGLIEEAAGTRMYEAKKVAAQKTIEKKQDKVTEISKVLSEEITPTLEKLRADRNEYLMWAANNTTCERLGRFCVAYEYVHQEELRTNGATRISALEDDISAVNAKVATLKGDAARKSTEIEVQAGKVAASKGGEFAALVKAEYDVGLELAKAQAAHDGKKAAVKDVEKARSGLAKQEKDADASIAKLTDQVTKQRADSQTAATLATKLAADVQTLQSNLMKAAAGMSTDAESDGGSGSGGGTVADMLMAAKRRVTEVESGSAQADMKARHWRGKVKELTTQAAAGEKEGAKLQSIIEKAKASVDSKKAAIASLGFDAKGEEGMRQQKSALEAALSSLESALESEAGPLSHYLDFSYDKKALGPSWDPSRVKGVAAKLMRIKRPEAAAALEVTAGGKLWNVVVDNDATGKALLGLGKQLKKRVTILPLNQIRPRALTQAQLAAAAEISGGKAIPAIQCVSYAPEHAKAIEFVLGDTFICENAEVAKAVCFDPRVRASCVTLAGDVFDPAGTLEGGSPPSSGGAGGQPLLIKIGKILDVEEKVVATRAQLSKVDAGLSSLSKQSNEYAKLCQELDMAEKEVEVQSARYAASSLGQVQQRLSDATAELAKEEAVVSGAKAALKEAKDKVKALEAEAANATAAREARTAAIEADLSKAKKQAGDADKKARKLAGDADAAQYEVDNAIKERQALATSVAAADAAVAAAKQEETAAAQVVAEVQSRHDAAKTRLEAAKAAVAAADKLHASLVKERQACLDAVDKAGKDLARLDKELASVKEGVQQASRAVADLNARHPWIAAEKQFFGEAHSDFDFKRTDPKKAHAELKALEKKQGELERRINKKVLGMIETAEREYTDLKSKKSIIENDKAKIEAVMRELDEKKNEALKTTWGKVNKDFGSIFGTLLPGVTAKLDPPEGGTVLDGLEVKVAFNGVWKDSLTELSGGQRSLLALSLILALLLFKPAPMYILDEVDAALDLSHTQNIGHMIRTHFGASQFIVVSLKQGMFSNANVVFRTKFVDGTSTVTRTVPGTSALLGGTAPGKAMAIGDADDHAAAENDENAGGAGAGKGKGKKARV